MAGDRRLDNYLNLRCTRMNGGLVECLITISMEIPFRDKDRRSARQPRRRFSHGMRGEMKRDERMAKKESSEYEKAT